MFRFQFGERSLMDISQEQREREREKTKEKNALSMLPAPPFAAFACAFSLALADFWPLPPPMLFSRKRDERKRKERIVVKNCSELLFFPS